ncbi:hypothetical protein QAD02_012484 [Eretmocerus hayati]|uniref:Uncharacterized protein n=1 Tax=Eretmocerus hayati TaxID=131215 RepID=A0ACC2NZV5_9HYME|nr:hypothetical protein QAD02_012484 [Eretmocerus hayati]
MFSIPDIVDARPDQKNTENFWRFVQKYGERLRKLFNAIKDFIGSVSKRFPSFSSNKLSMSKEPQKFDTKENETDAHDCFGLGSEHAREFESWLKGNKNSSSDVKVKFFINSRSLSHRVKVNDVSDIQSAKVDFKADRDTFVIVHGYLSSGEVDWVIEMEEAFLKWGDVNTIAVDWSDQHFALDYLKVARSTEKVGNQLATFLNQLSASTEKTGRLHLIGHSLGSHICGYTSYELKRRNALWLPQRITGLDPAKPCFESSDASVKLDHEDAPFVDVIHTNAKNSKTRGLSLFQPLGHLDFYPNGGKHQPGCTKSNYILPNSIKLPSKIIQEAICDHGKAHLYFTESIVNAVAKNCTFWAQSWDLKEDTAEEMLWNSCNAQSCIEMGINSEQYKDSSKGAYFVLTSGSDPSCKIHSAAEVSEVKEILEDTKNQHI